MVHALEFHWKPVSYTTYSRKYSKYMDNKTKEMVTICLTNDGTVLYKNIHYASITYDSDYVMITYPLT